MKKALEEGPHSWRPLDLTLKFWDAIKTMEWWRDHRLPRQMCTHLQDKNP